MWAFFEVTKEEEKYLRERLTTKNNIFFREPLDKKHLSKIKEAVGLVVFVNSVVSSDIIAALPQLRFIATMSTGYNHIAIEVCTKRKIVVSNVPSYGEYTVAEHTFGLLLSLAKKIPVAVSRTRRDDFSLNGLEGFDLFGKTIGIIGTGKIGKHVAERALCFGMKVIAYDLYPDKPFAKKMNMTYVPLSTLLKTVDIITIHAPLSEHTRYLINMQAVKQMKKGMYLINTARGEIIDTTALLYGLDHDIIAGAGLDVLEGECDIKEEKELLHEGRACDWTVLLENHALLKEKNVIVTPHSAFYTKEAVHRIWDTTLDNIQGFMKKKVKNRVA